MAGQFGTPLGLYSRQTSLDPSGEPEFVREAEVTIREPCSWNLELGDFTDFFRRRPKSAVTRHDLIQLIFSLRLLGEGGRFDSVSLRVRFETEGSRVMCLDPGKRAVEVPAELDFELRTEAFPDSPPAPSGVRLEKRALVTTWGHNSALAEWRFDAQPGFPIREGDSFAYAALELPPDVLGLTGKIDCEAVVIRPWLDAEEPVKAQPKRRDSLDLDLDLGKPL
jgi:hypothetical protein